MDVIKLSALISEDKKLIVDLPFDIPTGTVDILILPTEKSSPDVTKKVSSKKHLNWAKQREQIRKKLIQSQPQSQPYSVPKGYCPLSDAERMRLTILPPGIQPTSVIIDEERSHQHLSLENTRCTSVSLCNTCQN